MSDAERFANDPVASDYEDRVKQPGTPERPDRGDAPRERKTCCRCGRVSTGYDVRCRSCDDCLTCGVGTQGHALQCPHAVSDRRRSPEDVRPGPMATIGDIAEPTDPRSHDWRVEPRGPYSDATYRCRRCGLETADPGNHTDDCEPFSQPPPPDFLEMLNDMDVEAEEEAPATRGAAYWRERVDAMLAASKEASPVNAAFVLGREYGNASLEDAGHIVDELERLHGIPRSPQDVRGADVGEARAAAEEAWKHFNDRVRDRVEGEYGAFTNADWQAAVALRTALRSPEPAETGITQVRILAKALLDGRGREAFTPAEWSALWALAGGSPEPAAEPEEHPKPETVTEPRNPHDSKRLGGKSTDPVSVLVEEALDEIMDELSDYSKTLTTCGRIRVHLTVLQNASSLSRQPSLPPDER